MGSRIPTPHWSRTLVVLATCAAWATSTQALAATQDDQTQFSVTPGSLSFSTVPALPPLGDVVLNGRAQTTATQMTDFAIADATGSGSGWNVTVAGLPGPGDSSVFEQYCPNAGGCGSDPQGYVSDGAALPADSLTLNSTSADFVAQDGSTGTAPTLQCSSVCDIDSESAVKVASAAGGAGMGTWLTNAFAPNSLSLATPTTLRSLSNEEVYRVNLIWTLNTGP